MPLTETTWERTVALADVNQAPKRVVVNGYPILVSAIDGVPYAMADACLHRGLSLEGGRCADGVITCPEHWWRYSLRTGEHLGSPGEALTTYPARLGEDGVVEVEVPAAERVVSLREALLAHAREGKTDA